MWTATCFSHPQVAAFVKDFFDRMDLDNSGFITKAEYLKLNKRRVEEHVVAAFNAMDVNNNGKVQ